MKVTTGRNGGPPSRQPGNGNLAPLLEAATREVFDIMLQTSLDRSPVGDPPLVADLTVLVGLSGQVSGVVSLHCSADSAFRMAYRMTGTPSYDLDETVLDALSEICNMVAGNFKNKHPELADGCSISTPSVISGSDYHLHSLPRGEHAEVGFFLEESPIWVTLDLRNPNPSVAR